VTYISTTPTFGNEIAELVAEEVKNVQFEGKEEGEGDPVYAVMSIHRPFGLSVGAEALGKGFYKDLYSLQGKKRTWWTGAAWVLSFLFRFQYFPPDENPRWHAYDSSLIWRFREELLPNITAAV
jgi:hypothetical protein